VASRAESSPVRRRTQPTRRRRFAVAALGATAGRFASPAASFATQWWSGRNLFFNSPAAGICLWNEAQATSPSMDGHSLLDFNVFVWKNHRSSQNGCQPFEQPLYFENNETAVKAMLVRTDNGAVCAWTSSKSVPKGWYDGYGWGQAYQPTGACAGNKNWTNLASAFQPIGGTWQTTWGQFSTK
jgi:hypothetical protein